MSKPIKFWNNFMGMFSTEELCKSWVPKAEHEDIRCYVRADDYDALLAQAEAMVNILKDIQGNAESHWCSWKAEQALKAWQKFKESLS